MRYILYLSRLLLSIVLDCVQVGCTMDTKLCTDFDSVGLVEYLQKRGDGPVHPSLSMCWPSNELPAIPVGMIKRVVLGRHKS